MSRKPTRIVTHGRQPVPFEHFRPNTTVPATIIWRNGQPCHEQVELPCQAEVIEAEVTRETLKDAHLAFTVRDSRGRFMSAK
jgi:hypothetical protein